MDQTDFRAGLLNPDHPVPEGLLDGVGNAAGKRYSVYRNNVTVSLVEAMKTAFPLVSKLIGPQNFAQLARIFVRTHPPKSPLMMFYGADFPAFVADFAPLSHIGYLADAARFDLALRHSYHAGDVPAFDPAGFQTLSPEALLEATITFAPAAHVVESVWPLYDIWAFNQDPAHGKPRSIAQSVLITRPDYDPMPHALPPGAAVWVKMLRDGSSFGSAHDAALQDNPDFDLSASLSLALTSGALSKLNHKDLK